MANMFEKDIDLVRGDGRSTLRTNEGVVAVIDAIEFLKKQKPVKPIRWSNLMAEASKAHTLDIGPLGLITHQSTQDGVDTKARLRKFGKIINCYGESMSFNCINAKEVMMQLLVDDGSKSRGQRLSIFNDNFNIMSCFTGPHLDFESMTTINYSGQFVQHGEEDPIDTFMTEFLRQEVEFNMPQGVKSWKQKSRINVKGTTATKITTRTIRMKDGTEDVLTKEDVQEIQL